MGRREKKEKLLEGDGITHNTLDSGCDSGCGDITATHEIDGISLVQVACKTGGNTDGTSSRVRCTTSHDVLGWLIEGCRYTRRSTNVEAVYIVPLRNIDESPVDCTPKVRSCVLEKADTTGEVLDLAHTLSSRWWDYLDSCLSAASGQSTQVSCEGFLLHTVLVTTIPTMIDFTLIVTH